MYILFSYLKKRKNITCFESEFNLFNTSRLDSIMFDIMRGSQFNLSNPHPTPPKYQ